MRKKLLITFSICFLLGFGIFAGTSYLANADTTESYQDEIDAAKAKKEELEKERARQDGISSEGCRHSGNLCSLSLPGLLSGERHTGILLAGFRGCSGKGEKADRHGF